MPTEIQVPTGDAIVEIRQLHEELIEHRDAAVGTAHRCGTLLAEIAQTQGEMFAGWLTANLPEIPTRRVVNLIQLSSRALPEGDSVSRQFLLKIADETENVSEKKPSIRVEAHLIFVNRICQWFSKRTNKDPIEDWDETDRARLKRELEPLAKIYATLCPTPPG